MAFIGRCPIAPELPAELANLMNYGESLGGMHRGDSLTVCQWQPLGWLKCQVWVADARDRAVGVINRVVWKGAPV